MLIGRFDFAKKKFQKALGSISTAMNDIQSELLAELFDLTPDQLLTPGRYPAVVRARSLLCYWAVRELGVTATDLAKQIGMTQPAISISVKRGEKIAKETEFSIESLLE
jgi:DNA-binding MarR family transcriptional regulator